MASVVKDFQISLLLAFAFWGSKRGKRAGAVEGFSIDPFAHRSKELAEYGLEATGRSQMNFKRRNSIIRHGKINVCFMDGRDSNRCYEHPDYIVPCEEQRNHAIGSKPRIWYQGNFSYSHRENERPCGTPCGRNMSSDRSVPFGHSTTVGRSKSSSQSTPSGRSTSGCSTTYGRSTPGGRSMPSNYSTPSSHSTSPSYNIQSHQSTTFDFRMSSGNSTLPSFTIPFGHSMASDCDTSSGNSTPSGRSISHDSNMRSGRSRSSGCSKQSLCSTPFDRSTPYNYDTTSGRSTPFSHNMSSHYKTPNGHTVFCHSTPFDSITSTDQSMPSGCSTVYSHSTPFDSKIPSGRSTPYGCKKQSRQSTSSSCRMPFGKSMPSDYNTPSGQNTPPDYSAPLVHSTPSNEHNVHGHSRSGSYVASGCSTQSISTISPGGSMLSAQNTPSGHSTPSGHNTSSDRSTSSDRTTPGCCTFSGCRATSRRNSPSDQETSRRSISPSHSPLPGQSTPPSPRNTASGRNNQSDQSTSSSRNTPSSNSTPSVYSTSSRSGNPPSVRKIQLLLQKKGDQRHQEDKVWPNLYLGNVLSAMDKDKLHSLGITHILNAAHHTKGVSTDAQYYKGLPITYFGLKTLDERTFDMSCFFGPASKFIDMGLRTPGGKVLVHCFKGKSRSATLVLAYLMIYQNMTLLDALVTVSAKRHIGPNEGFLQDLRHLDKKLQKKRANIINQTTNNER